MYNFTLSDYPYTEIEDFGVFHLNIDEAAGLVAKILSLEGRLDVELPDLDNYWLHSPILDEILVKQIQEYKNEIAKGKIPAFVRKYEYKKRKIHKNEGPIPTEPEAEERVSNWKEELLSVIQAMKPDAFERLSQRVLRENGFTKVQVTGKSGDGGIDGIGILRLNLLSFHVSFQCKRYQGSVGSSHIRDFRGAMIGRGDKGLFITTGNFTSDARKEASRDGAPAIDLIDGEELCDLLKALSLGVQTEMVEKVTLKPEWFEGI